MKYINNFDTFRRMYSVIFSVGVLALLVAFNVSVTPDLSTISTNFRWRKELISLYNSFRLNVGDRLFNQTLVGKGGWFFYTGEQSVEDYQGIAVIRPNKLTRMQKKLDQLSAQLKVAGVTLLVVIPPNKSTIYLQYMPDGIPVIGQQTRLDQFLDHMRLYGNTPILDLRPVLLTASQSQDVYYKTDTHWNDIGAYLVYVEIMTALSTNHPSLTPRSMSDYSYSYAGDAARDLPLLMGLPNYLEADWVLMPHVEVQREEATTVLPDGRSIRTVTHADDQLPTLLVFGDSFYVSLARFLEPHFSRTKTIPFTYENDVWTLDWIEREKTDVVIIEIAERVLDISLPMLLEN